METDTSKTTLLLECNWKFPFISCCFKPVWITFCGTYFVKMQWKPVFTKIWLPKVFAIQLKSKVYIHFTESAKCWLFYQVWVIIQNACYCLFSTDLGSVLRTSLITSEIKWKIQDDIIALIRIWLIRFFERTCCWWLVWLDWVIWWFKRGYASILETTISNVAIGWWQDSNVMTSYH